MGLRGKCLPIYPQIPPEADKSAEDPLFGMNRTGYFLRFFDFLVFLAFLADLHPQVLHMVLTSFNKKHD